MMKDDPQLKPQYRMPRVFGALPGPRNVPADKRGLANRQRNTILSVTARTDADLLARLLPDGCRLEGPTDVTVSLNFMENIGWLAGRGYGFLGVSFRMIRESAEGGRLPGYFLPVCWENLADPILTGREELGFAKLYADLHGPVILGDSYAASASWMGFGFFSMEVFDTRDGGAQPPAPMIGSFHHKFIPHTGKLGTAEVDQLVYAGPGQSVAGYAPLAFQRRLVGSGRVRFNRARWEDMPFQYPIINALAELPLGDVIDASVTFLAAEGSIGNPSAGALKPLDQGAPVTSQD